VAEQLPPQSLLEHQNSDGGWGYHGGGSWTEPTCYALLALAASGLGGSDAFGRGAQWLARRQGADGGFVPRESVDESTWVTALVLLLPAELTPGLGRDRASAWLVSQTGRESGWLHRLRLRLLGVRSDVSLAFDGWPWYPGAAAWVTPTAVSILALEKLDRLHGDASIRERIAQGRAFLLARRCRDGGWNHGSTRALGYDSDSYPETTGAALLALHAIDAPEVAAAVAVAERHLSRAQSLEAASWLTLALIARGRRPPTVELPSHGGTMEIALAALARKAGEGLNLFLE
jgi:hypothetical protein